MSRYTDIADEPITQILPPLPNCDNVPLVTLEQAIQPVSHLFQGIDWYVWVAKENSLHPADGLTPDESASIYLYTMSCSNGPSLYQLLNEHLRAENRETLRPWLAFLKLLLTGLRKLPSQSQTVWCGVSSISLWRLYPYGGHLTWWGVHSCVSTPGMLEDPANTGGEVVKALFSIECQNAKLITAHCRDREAGREEFILLPGTCLEVMEQIRGEGSSVWIRLKEIESIAPPSSLSGTSMIVVTMCISAFMHLSEVG